MERRPPRGPLEIAALSDEEIASGLWNFNPADAKHVMHERRVRFGVHEEMGDPEYG